MDPNAALERLRTLAIEALKEDDALDPHLAVLAIRAIEMAEKFQALDEWITKGGFPPDDWVSE
jgi:hypothetical protein